MWGGGTNCLPMLPPVRPGPKGRRAQHVIPGAERVGDGALAQRRADAPMCPTLPQKPAAGTVLR
jgi:hypothetical protein